MRILFRTLQYLSLVAIAVAAHLSVISGGMQGVVDHWRLFLLLFLLFALGKSEADARARFKNGGW